MLKNDNQLKGSGLAWKHPWRYCVQLCGGVGTKATTSVE